MKPEHGEGWELINGDCIEELSKQAEKFLRAEVIWRADDFDTDEAFDAFQPTVEETADVLELHDDLAVTRFEVVSGDDPRRDTELAGITPAPPRGKRIKARRAPNVARRRHGKFHP